MKSWILIASYLWKDTWKRWFEQPGSILARVVVTAIMVGISLVLLVAFTMQVNKVRKEMEAFGINSMLVVETVSPSQLKNGKVKPRFSEIGKWGELLTVKKLLVRGKLSNGERVAVMSYTDDAMVSLSPYLKNGFSEFLLTNKYSQGTLIDVQIKDTWIRARCLTPREEEARLLQGDVLFLPSAQYPILESAGHSILYFLERYPDAPSIELISHTIRNVDTSDAKGGVDIRSSVVIKERLRKLEKQQTIMRYAMAGLLGGALALIYGTLSVLEFRQQRYVAALMRSFGVPKLFLAVRNIIESLVIVNLVSFGVIFGLKEVHSEIFKALKLENTGVNLHALYFSNEIFWVIGFVNLGVFLSSLPTIRAMSKPVGKILS